MVTGPLAESTLRLLDAAIRQWQSAHGYLFVDLPWIVPTRFTDATRPLGNKDVVTNHGAFVASGEQSFLQLWTGDQLPRGVPGYVGWTPCLRDEPVLDDLHQYGFIKAELFVPLASPRCGRTALETMLQRQAELFVDLALLAGHPNPNVVREWICASQCDLTVNGIEVGSYGFRAFDGKPYLYGTALALPRFLQALTHCDTTYNSKK